MALLMGRPASRDERPDVPGHWPAWLVVAVVAVAYASGAQLAFAALGATAIVVLFLPAGVTLSALVLSPRRQWPWILAAVAVTEIAVDVSHGQSLAVAAGFAATNTAEPLVGALLFRRYVPGDVDLLRRRDLVAFLACCVVAGPLVGALCGATTISLGLDRSWLVSLLPFWAGDATGVLTVGGCVLAWRHRPAAGTATVTRWVLAVAATVAVTALGFWQADLPLFYLPIPLLFWLAFGQRLSVALSCGIAMTVTANVLTSAGHGPWAAFEGPAALRTATLQLFLAVAILGAWFLAVGVAERDTARQATSAERAARQRLHALQEFTARLTTAATTQAIAEAVVRESVARVADGATLAVVSSDKDMMATWTAAGDPPDLIDPGQQLALATANPLTAAARTGRLVVHQSLDELAEEFPAAARADRAIGLHSGVCLPVVDGDGVPVGALACGFAREQAVDGDTIALVRALASLTGQALERARSYEQERDAAHQLQRALLPVLAGQPGIQISSDYRPADSARDVGGDWYDVFALPGDRIGVAVGDVAGHDLTAAAAMARLQSALRILAQSAGGPAAVLEQLDRASGFITDSFMTTIGYAEYDPASGVLRYACAGHPPPLLLTAAGGQYLWDGRSAPVGVAPAPRPQAECVVPAGSTLIWYTDGLIERYDTPLLASLDRLATEAGAHATLDPDALCQAVLRHMAGEDAQRDDTVVLCIRFTAGPPAGAVPAPRSAVAARPSPPA